MTQEYARYAFYDAPEPGSEGAGIDPDRVLNPSVLRGAG